MRSKCLAATESMFSAAEGGDAFAAEMFEETGFLLGVGIANIVSALNVEMIAFAGGLANAGERIFGPARRTYLERGTVGVKEHVRIVPAELGDDAGILGAARLAREEAESRSQDSGARREAKNR